MRKLTYNEYVTKFWQSVAVGAPDECWAFLGRTNEKGYGYFYFMGKSRRVHRIAYELVCGQVPAGLELDHLCRTRACCNPAHLEPVTHRENTLRGETIVAAHAAKTHCPQGHPYNEQNTIWYRDTRLCRTCQRDHKRAYQLRKRSAVAA